MGMQPGKRRQQRGMYVDQSVLPAPHKPWGDDAHEAGLADQLHAGGFQPVGQRPFEALPVREILVRDGLGRHPGLGGALQPLNVWNIGDHQHDFGGKQRVPGRVQQGLQIAASPGNQHSHFQAITGHRFANLPEFRHTG